MIPLQFYHTYERDNKYYTIHRCDLGSDIRYIILNYGTDIINDVDLKVYIDEDAHVVLDKTIEATEEEIKNYKNKQELEAKMLKEYLLAREAQGYSSVPISG